MLDDMVIDFMVLLVGTTEGEVEGRIGGFDHMSGCVTVVVFKTYFYLITLVGAVLEAETGGVESGGLFGVAHVEQDVIKFQKFPDAGSLSWFCVVHFN